MKSSLSLLAVRALAPRAFPVLAVAFLQHGLEVLPGFVLVMLGRGLGHGSVLRPSRWASGAVHRCAGAPTYGPPRRGRAATPMRLRSRAWPVRAAPRWSWVGDPKREPARPLHWGNRPTCHGGCSGGAARGQRTTGPQT